MGWSNREGVDYEDAKRPTADEETNKSGWVAYYAWGRGGGGIHTPHYVYMPGWTDISDIRDSIVYSHESWMHDAEYAGIAIHRGVTPPFSVIDKARMEAAENLRLANELFWDLSDKAANYVGDKSK